ncbi:MAG: hypothetical protein ACO1SV_19400 [Fimbriimonas sp.]
MQSMPRTVVIAGLAALATTVLADAQDRIYDFTDAYYKTNGVDPLKVQGRRQGDGRLGVIDKPFFSYQRNVRSLLTFSAYKDNGSPAFWTVVGDINVDGFTKDAAGRKAREIADRSPIYVFPTRTGDPIGLGNNRQSDVVDMRHGYFSNNPLGLWLHIWISYTDQAFTTKDGKKELESLAKKNGLALDGTPIIKTLSEIEKLVSKGFAKKRYRKWDGSEGAMYGICPVIKDPTKGGIASDSFLAYVRKADGQPLEVSFVQEFNSLLSTGNWSTAGKP